MTKTPNPIKLLAKAQSVIIFDLEYQIDKIEDHTLYVSRIENEVKKQFKADISIIQSINVKSKTWQH
jgi:hypothetical protein